MGYKLGVGGLGQSGTNPVRDTPKRVLDVYGGYAGGRVPKGGGFDVNQPTIMLSERRKGYRSRAFFDDFYNRVYLLPGVIDFRAVAGRARRTFRVWNAWLRYTTLAQVIREAVDSTSISGPEAPTVYAPLELREYEASVDADGPAQFLANYRFVFDTGEMPGLQLLGERARRLPFGVNWREPYQISFEFKTDILTSRSGREQRRATRQSARKAVSYKTMATRAGVRQFNQHMVTWQNRVIIMPEETTFVSTTTPTLAGNSVLVVEAVPHWLRVGTTVYLRSADVEMVGQVEQIVGDSIRLSVAVERDMPAGARVMVALYGRLGTELSSTRETNTVFQTDIDFQVNPASEQERILPPAPMVLNGRPVLLMKPNWSRRPNVSYIQTRETVDYGVGRTEVFTPIDFTTRQTQYLFSGTAAKLEEFVEHFIRMRGAAGEFYYPTWEPDFPQPSPIIAGTRGLEFEGSDIYDAYAGDSVYRGVMVVLKDGRRFLNTLREEIGFADGRTILTMRDNWPASVQPVEIEMISWLLVNRFAGDKLTFEWLTREVGQVQATFRTLEDRS